MNDQDLTALYLLAQHGVAALFQRVEAALAAVKAAQTASAKPVDSTPPTA